MSPHHNLPPYLAQVFLEAEPPETQILAKAKELVEHCERMPKWSSSEYRYFDDTLGHKNRYRHRIPYERSRVRLQYKGDDYDGADYINASYLQLDAQSRMYIASQAPIPPTFCDFWHMVWEQNVALIVALVAVQRRRCEQYWPGDQHALVFSDIVVELISEEVLLEGDICLRKFRVGRNGSLRIVAQLHYHSWPDHGVPRDPEAITAALRLSRASAEYVSRPTVVHCSAGIGRTGTFCALDSILSHPLAWSSQEDLVLEVVKKFRDQRNDMVETFEQFRFIYRFLHKHYSTRDPPSS